MQLGPTDPSSIQIPDDRSTAQSGELSDEQTNAQTDTQSGSTVESQESSPVAIERLIQRLQTSDSLPAILFSVGILLMVLILMRKLLRNTKANRRRTNSLPTPQDRIAQINNKATTSMDISTTVMVETEEMARRLGAIMDNKAARLELLIEEADRKLAQLNQSLVRSAISSQPSTTPPPDPHARALDPTLLDRARLEQDIEDRQSRVAGRIDHTQSPELKPTPSPAPSPAPQPTQQETTQSKVIELADAGCTNIEIAHQLNQPIGQVELILNLRKQQG